MITASIGSHRFESGPNYHFNDSTFDELVAITEDPNPTTDFLNLLPKVDATPDEIRDVAASGIARLALDGSDLDTLKQAGLMIVDVCGGGVVSRQDFAIRRGVGWTDHPDVFSGRKLSNHKLDSASVLATRKNREEETAEIIRDTSPAEEGYFIIALANGGLISAARTFIRLGEGEHRFDMVRFSRSKNGDKEPYLYPSRDRRIDWLKHQARGRQVIVFDEDHISGDTLRIATYYFAKLFGKKVVGVAPVNVARNIEYNPLILTSE